MNTEGRPTAAILLGICLYEATALVSFGRVPTISALLRSQPRQLRAVVVAGATSWLAVHLLDTRWDLP